ncbi:MAG: phosphatase PAP2 family protein [Thermodesulfobacteriota bacterium]
MAVDNFLFYLINEKSQNSFFDWFMPLITDLKNSIFLLLALGLWILYQHKKEGIIFLIFMGITLAITDQFSSSLLKDLVGRIRPCHTLTEVRLLTDCNTSYSFPSSHAVNIFAAAFFLAKQLKKFSIFFYALASLVAYSRVYIGIHYPFDALGGAALGLLIAWPLHRLNSWVVENFKI